MNIARLQMLINGHKFRHVWCVYVLRVGCFTVIGFRDAIYMKKRYRSKEKQGESREINPSKTLAVNTPCDDFYELLTTLNVWSRPLHICHPKRLSFLLYKTVKQRTSK